MGAGVVVGGERAHARSALAARVQAQPLAVHLARRVGAQVDERVGDLVGVGEGLVGLLGVSASRICGVTIALTTAMLAVPPVSASSAAKVSVQASAAALVAA